MMVMNIQSEGRQAKNQSVLFLKKDHNLQNEHELSLEGITQPEYFYELIRKMFDMVINLLKRAVVSLLMIRLLLANNLVVPFCPTKRTPVRGNFHYGSAFHTWRLSVDLFWEAGDQSCKHTHLDALLFLSH